MIDVKFDESELLAVKAIMAGIKNGYPKVMARTINETLKQSKTHASREIAKTLNLKIARIKKDFTIDKANWTYITGRLIAKGKRVGLFQFAANQIKTGVSVKIYKGKPRKLYKHAFIAEGKGDTGKQVFWRTWDKHRVKPRPGFPYQNLPKKYRHPLERLSGPAIEDIYMKPEVFNEVMAFINLQKYVILEREMAYELRKLA